MHLLPQFHGTCVAKGSANTKKLVCPFHGWEYNLEGMLKKIPKDGSILNIHERNLNLKPIPVKEAGDFLFLYLGDGVEKAFDPAIENLLSGKNYQDLNFLKRVEYEIPCN
jgi:phenylpropionate dioxygenase-like ring-hydroxylating dioxygenase large terminal subunit